VVGLFHLLRCIARAAVKNGVRALASLVPAGEAVFEIARDAQEEYRKDKSEAVLRAELETLARTSPREVPTAEGVIRNQEASGQPAEVRLELVSYLDRHEASRTVASPRRTYTLLDRLGAGDAADVHLARAEGEAETHFVLKTARAPGGLVLLENERRTLVRLSARARDTSYHKYLPDLLESFTSADGSARRVNVFAYDPGFYTLEQIHERHPALDGRHLAWIFKRLLTVLGFSHCQGIVHGAILPCHVLLHTAGHGLRLVGWGQSVRIGRRIETVSPRFEDWYPPEVRKKQPTSPATDLFLAARCLIYLAGGDPVRDRMPDAVPEPLRRFVQSCLLEGVLMRPDDAWALLDEFDELLHRLYGPPKFHDLSMT
jgi:serine/threonine protein kinase